MFKLGCWNHIEAHSVHYEVVIFHLIALIKGQIGANVKQPVSVVLEQLLLRVTSDHMSDLNCLVLVTNQGSDYEWNLNANATVNVVVSPDFLADMLSYSFDYNCQGYIVQLPNPREFLDVWEVRRSDDLRRHSPKMLFLPWNETSYSDFLFSSNVAELLPDILAIQVLVNGPTEEDVKLEMITNNFYESAGDPNRAPGISLGIWPTNATTNWFPDKTLDLRGKTIKVATLQYPPYSQLTPTFDGMEVKLVQTFCEHYNCTLVTVSDNDLWGELWENKSGNGVVGNVYMGKADVGMGAVYLWYNEYKYLEFSYPYLESRVTVLVPKPGQLPEWSIPIIAFSPAMWGVVLLSIATTAVILYFLNKNAGKISRDHYIHTGEFETFSGILMRTFGMALLQPPSARFESGSVVQRFFTLFEVLFLLFTTIYSGALSSVLTIPVYDPPIDSPMDLYKSGITWMADHDAWIYSLQQATEPYLQGLVKKFQAHETEDLIAYSKQGGYGFSIEIMAAGHVTHTAHLSGQMILGLHVMKRELYTTPSVSVFRKGSPFLEKYDWLVHRCLDAGFFLAWETQSTVKYLSSRLQTALKLSESSSQELHPPVKLRLNHVQGAFIMLAIGSVGASVIFLIEIIYHRQTFSVQTFQPRGSSTAKIA